MLMCDHCKGHYLGSMEEVMDPSDLINKAMRLHEAGCRGFLLSGGCDLDGCVPIEPFIPAIEKIKQSTDLRINVHVGLIGPSISSKLVRAGTDCFSVDIVQDERVIRDVLHLDADPYVYERSLSALFNAGPKAVVPHICAGLQSKDAENACIEMVSRFNITITGHTSADAHDRNIEGRSE